MKFKRRRRRGFLNSQEGLAAYEWEVSRYGGDLAIRDCDRTVNLEFSFDWPKRKRSAGVKLRKLQRLIDALVEFHAVLEEAAESIGFDEDSE